MGVDTPTSRTGLIRALGPAMATAVVVGTVIGSGIFKKPQSVAANIDSFGLTALVWILGGVLVFLGALALGEVAVLYPRAGGNYVFLREAYGRMAGFLWGWVEFCIIRAASLGALATVFSESFNDLMGRPLGYWPLQALTMSTIVVLAGVNILGVRWGGGLQLFITLVKIGSLLGILALPFLVAALAGSDSTVPKPDTENMMPILPEDWGAIRWSGVGTALLGVLWAYHGWMNVAPVAEEIRRPQRNLPLALILGVAIIVFLYLGANLAYSLVLTRDEMKEMTATPVVTGFSEYLLGPKGAAVASAVVMCSVFGALNGNILVGPRVLYAMGEDRLAPRALAEVHARFHTPTVAIIVLAIWSCLLVAVIGVVCRVPAFGLADKNVFDILTDFVIFASVVFETMAVVSIFVFRRTRPDAERPYRCWGYPVVPALYVILPALVLFNMCFERQLQVVGGTLFVGLGALVYLVLYRNTTASG
jgi:amino acid transporter